MGSHEVSQNEKVETLLAVAGIVGLSDAETKGYAYVLPESSEDWSAFSAETREALSQRARALNSAPVERRRVWLALWHERLKRRGRTHRLDANVHPEQIAHVLKDEPPAVRLIIESHLPDDIAVKVSIILQSTSLFSFVKSKVRGSRPDFDPRMMGIVRSRFLDEFIAFEDLVEPSEMEQFSTRELGNFIWQLGLREIAYVCRGISKKETLAGFLKQFEEETAKEIGNQIAATGNVGLGRVKEAENRAKFVFQTQSGSEERVRRMGMEIFAETLARRPEPVVRFNLQKLPLTIADGLSERIRSLREKTPHPATDALVKEIERLAMSFRKGGLR